MSTARLSQAAGAAILVRPSPGGVRPADGSTSKRRACPFELVGWAHGQRAARRIAGALVASSWLCACDQSDNKAAAPAPSSSQPSQVRDKTAPVERVVCAEAKKGARFLVGEVGKGGGDQDPDGGGAIDLPFAVEVGDAVSISDGFAVAALNQRRAIVGLVPPDGAGGTIVELEEVHGDVEPPKLASYGNALVAAVVGNDAGGGTLSLAGIQRAAGAATVTRGAQVTRARSASSAFDLTLGQDHGLLVWDEWSKSSAHGTVQALVFDPGSLAARGEPRLVSPADDDAETPRVVPRPGGFWLSWVSHGPPDKHAPPAPDNDAGEPFDSIVDTTPRRLKLMPLGRGGEPAAEATLVTAVDAHVLAYDMVPFGDGVLLAWRDDPTTLGAEAPEVHLARIGADGNVALELIDDELVAAGAPRFLSEATAKGPGEVWLALMGKQGRSRVGYVAPTGKLRGPLQDVPGFGTNEPLARSGARFLLGQPNGRALDLSVVDCHFAPPEPSKRAAP